jgi:hypothetical protein
MTEIDQWEKDSADYLSMRHNVGSEEGDKFAAELVAMGPKAAAAQLSGPYSLCAPEDLAGELSGELDLDSDFALKVAAEIILLWWPAGDWPGPTLFPKAYLAEYPGDAYHQQRMLMEAEQIRAYWQSQGVRETFIGTVAQQ